MPIPQRGPNGPPAARSPLDAGQFAGASSATKTLRATAKAWLKRSGPQPSTGSNNIPPSQNSLPDVQVPGDDPRAEYAVADLPEAVLAVSLTPRPRAVHVCDVRGLGVIVLLTGCSVAVMASGDFGGAGILLLLLTMLLVVRWAPFRNLPLSHRGRPASRRRRSSSSDGSPAAPCYGGGESVTPSSRASSRCSRSDAPRTHRAHGRRWHPSTPHPPRPEGRHGGFISSRSPVSRRERVLARCAHEDKDTVQDDYEIIIGRWFGTGFPGITHKSVRGKMGQRATFRSCAECGSLPPRRAGADVHPAPGGRVLLALSGRLRARGRCAATSLARHAPRADPVSAPCWHLEAPGS